MKWKKTPKELGINLYQKPNGKFFYSFTINGRALQRRKLDSISKMMALKEGQKKQADHDAFRNGLTSTDPFGTEQVESSSSTVGLIAEAWEAAGYEDFLSPDLRPLSAERRAEYLKDLKWAVEFFREYDAEGLTQKDLDDFMRWRTRDAIPGGLLRSTDKALAKLSALLTWATRRTLIKRNPISRKIRYQRKDDIHHCSEFKPASDEELHQLARYFFRQEDLPAYHQRRSLATEAIGWQLLFEAYTGCRTSEILAMRLDAKEGQAGFVNWSQEYIAVDRLKKGIHPWVEFRQAEGIHPLVDLIHAHDTWHKKQFGARGPLWYFPSACGTTHLGEGTLTNSLRTATKALGLPKRTSHGLRAFYVHTARSVGMCDTEIAIRLGQSSGVTLIQSTYGVAEPNWIGSMKQDWLPEPAGDISYAVPTSVPTPMPERAVVSGVA